MVQEHGYSSYPYVADPQDRKTTYKAMETSGLRGSAAINSGSSSSSSSSNKNAVGNKRQKGGSQSEGWGPVFKNKQHFLDMHIC